MTRGDVTQKLERDRSHPLADRFILINKKDNAGERCLAQRAGCLRAQLEKRGDVQFVRSVRCRMCDELRQWLDGLEFIVHLGGGNFLAHRGKDAVINDASRVRPLWIEGATDERGFGRFLLIVGDLSGG